MTKLSETQKILVESAADLGRRLTERSVELDRLAEPISTQERREYGQRGLLGITLAEEYGGLGLGLYDALCVLQELAKVSVAIAFPAFECNTGPARIIERFGSESLKKSILPRVTTGEMLVGIAMSEPEAGSAATDLKTHLIKDRDRLLLSGTKRWCSGGGESEGYVVLCRMNDRPGAAGIGAVFVERDCAGVSFGKRELLMGWRGVPSADIYFDDVLIPVEQVICTPGQFGLLMSAFNIERCGNTAMSIGVAQGALQGALSYAKERTQFGRPIIEFQAVQMQLADMAVAVEASNALLREATVALGSELPDSAQVSLAKLQANTAVREVTIGAMQIMGAYGYADEYGMEQRVRDSFGFGIAGGTLDMQRLNIASGLAGQRFSQRPTTPTQSSAQRPISA